MPTNRKTPVPSLDDDDGLEEITATPAAAPAPAVAQAPAVLPEPPPAMIPEKPKRRHSVGERFLEALGYRRYQVGELRLPPPPSFDVERALAASPELPALKEAVRRWREIRVPLLELTPARIRERVAAVKDNARLDPYSDATKAAEEVATLERRLNEENAIREGQMRMIFAEKIAPAGVAVLQSALVPAREALAAVEEIDASIMTAYGAKTDVARPYREAVAQLQQLVDELTGERGNFNLTVPQGRYYHGIALPDLFEALCPETPDA